MLEGLTFGGLMGDKGDVGIITSMNGYNLKRA